MVGNWFLDYFLCETSCVAGNPDPFSKGMGQAPPPAESSELTGPHPKEVGGNTSVIAFPQNPLRRCADVPRVSGSDGLASHAATMKNKGRTIGEASPSARLEAGGGAPLTTKGFDDDAVLDFPTSCVAPLSFAPVAIACDATLDDNVEDAREAEMFAKVPCPHGPIDPGRNSSGTHSHCKYPFSELHCKYPFSADDDMMNIARKDWDLHLGSMKLGASRGKKWGGDYWKVWGWMDARR